MGEQLFGFPCDSAPLNEKDANYDLHENVFPHSAATQTLDPGFAYRLGIFTNNLFPTLCSVFTGNGPSIQRRSPP